MNLKMNEFVWPIIDKNVREKVMEQLDETISIYDNSGIIGELESDLRSYFRAKKSLLTNSGTSALHSLFIGIGAKEGDEIICPAYTFFSTVTPIFFTGAIPILVDCDENGNADPKEIRKKISKKTKAIIVTHLWGMPCKMKEIKDLATKYNLLLLEDISHAAGAMYKGQKVGTFGNATASSMQSQKSIAAGEGGFILTNNDEIFYRALLLGHFNKRCKSEIPKDHSLYKFSTTGMGLKLRIHPLAAVIAREHLKNLDMVIEKRSKVANRIIKELIDLPGLEFPKLQKDVKPSWYALTIKYNSKKFNNKPIEDFVHALKEEGCVEVDMPGSTCPLNQHPLFQNPGEIFPNYKGRMSYSIDDFPKANNLHRNLIKLPVWHKDEDNVIVEKYITAFRKIVNEFKKNG